MTENENMSVPVLRSNLHQEFSVSLESYGAAGYVWEAHYDRAVVSMTQKVHEPSTSGTIGNSGTEVFTFVPEQRGTTEIRFLLRRPWEREAEVERIYSVIIE